MTPLYAGVLALVVMTFPRPADDPVTGAEILTLLRAGVASEDIVAYLDRRKFPPPAVTEAEGRAMEALGAGTEILARLRILARMTEIESLAEAYGSFDSPDGRFRGLVPRTFALSPAGSPTRFVFEATPRPDASWFQGSRLFLFAVDGPSIPEAARPAVLRRILLGMVRRGVGGGLRISGEEITGAAGGTGLRFEARGEAGRGGRRGLLGFEARCVRPDLIVILGYEAPLDERAFILESFRVFSESLKSVEPATAR